MPLRIGRVPLPWLPGVFRSPTTAAPTVEGSADSARWRTKAFRRDVTICRLKAALERADGRYRQLHAWSERRRQSSLNQDVLRAVLPIRAGHPLVSALDRRHAADREERLIASCKAYQDLLSAPASVQVSCIETDGLRWWVPAKTNAHRLPYRAILQTREVAIGGAMIDIGANVGRTSVPRLLLGDVRTVYAAEPEPVNYECLVRNLAEHSLHGFLLPYPVAIGDVRGEMRMRRSRYPGGHRLLGAAAAAGDDFVVQVWPLDEWVGHVGLDPDAISFVKSDTQGFELHVLRGARQLLARRHIAWLIELDPVLLARAGTRMAELLALLQTTFSHFIDIGAAEPGPRVRATRQLSECLDYVGTRQTKTDLLLFHACSTLDAC